MDNLRRAVLAKQTEVNDVHRQIEHEEVARRQRIDAINRQIQLVNSQIGGSSTNSDQQARLSKQIMDMETEKTKIDHQQAAIRQGREEQIRTLENQWRDIDRKIGDLQRTV